MRLDPPLGKHEYMSMASYYVMYTIQSSLGQMLVVVFKLVDRAPVQKL